MRRLATGKPSERRQGKSGKEASGTNRRKSGTGRVSRHNGAGTRNSSECTSSGTNVSAKEHGLPPGRSQVLSVVFTMLRIRVGVLNEISPLPPSREGRLIGMRSRRTSALCLRSSTHRRKWSSSYCHKATNTHASVWSIFFSMIPLCQLLGHAEMLLIRITWPHQTRRRVCHQSPGSFLQEEHSFEPPTAKGGEAAEGLPGVESPSAVNGQRYGRLAERGGEPDRGSDDGQIDSVRHVPFSAQGLAPVGKILVSKAVTCQKRGRAQKKRARKVKDKMRHICIEAAVAEAAAAADCRVAFSTPKATNVKNEGSSSPVRNGSIDAGSRRSPKKDGGHNGSKTLTLTPWPKLERAAKDLAILAWARTRQQRGGAPLAVAAVGSEGAAIRQEAAEGSREETLTVPTAVTEDNATVAFENEKSRVVAMKSTDAKEGQLIGEDLMTSHSIAHEGSAVGVYSMDERASLPVSEPVEPAHFENRSGAAPKLVAGALASDEAAPLVSPALLEVGGDTKAACATGTVVGAIIGLNTNTNKVISAGGCVSEVETEAVSVAAEVVCGEYDPGGADKSLSANVLVHKKTRRGKRSGGAINRRRGAKERAASRLSASQQASTSNEFEPCSKKVAGTEEGDKVCLLAVKPSSIAMPSSQYPVGEKLAKLGPNCRAPVEGLHISCDGAEGCASDAECESRGGNRGVSIASAATVNSRTLNGESWLGHVPAFECAAAKAIRELSVMVSTLSTPSASPSSKVEVTNRHSLPLRVTAPTSAPPAGGVGRFQSQIRTRGVLESLLVICAPFPWIPVLTALASDSSTRAMGDFPPNSPPLENGSTLRASSLKLEAGGRVVNSPAPPLPESTEVFNFSDSIKVPSVGGERGDNSTPRMCKADRELPPASHERGAGGVKPTLGRDGSGIREVLTESALEILEIALAEPDNREYVLRVDGAAPLVRIPDALISFQMYNFVVLFRCVVIGRGVLLIKFSKSSTGLGTVLDDRGSLMFYKNSEDIDKIHYSICGFERGRPKVPKINKFQRLVF